MQNFAKKCKSEQKTLVLVPTMGALHEGHLKLIDRAKSRGNDGKTVVIVSIFVNPTQFAPNEDFNKYPRKFENDCKKCEERGADLVFAPNAENMYPDGFDTKINCGKITTVLEGEIRPTHFDGVCTVVLKLFNITLADIAIFGQKDAQQVMVLKQMARDLNLTTEIDVHPIVREKDGLAMSSRNAYLTPDERAEVAEIYSGLKKARDLIAKERHSYKIKEFLLDYYSRKSYFVAEYIEITNFSAEKIAKITDEPALISVAMRTTQSKTRLIDNIITETVK